MQYYQPTIGYRILKHRILYLLILPTFVLLAIFNYTPATSALINAFYRWNGGEIREFIGLRNFIHLFQDRVLIASAGNLVKLILANVLIALTVPLLVAELIYNLRNKRAQYWFRVLFVIPMVIPGLVIILIWQIIYNGDIGLINQFLKVIGLEHIQTAWLGNPDTALYAIVFMGFPWVGSINLLIYYAGLQDIPRELFDACKVDGARFIQRFLHIDVPMIIGQIRLLLILSIIGTMQGFQHILIMTRGGPGSTTMVPSLWMYQMGFGQGKLGYATAIGVVLFIIIFILTFINMRFVRIEK